MTMMMMTMSHSAVLYNYYYYYVLGISLSARGLEFEAGHRYVMMMYGNPQQSEQETYQHWTLIRLKSSLEPLL